MPWDGIDDVDFDATLYSRLFQMVHDLEGATIELGLAVGRNGFSGCCAERIGVEQGLERRGQLDVRRLSRWGYQWVIVDGRSPNLEKQSTYGSLGEFAFIESCDILMCTVWRRQRPKKSRYIPFPIETYRHPKEWWNRDVLALR